MSGRDGETRQTLRQGEKVAHIANAAHYGGVLKQGKQPKRVEYLHRGLLRQVYIVTETRNGSIYKTKPTKLYVACRSDAECVKWPAILV